MEVLAAGTPSVANLAALLKEQIVAVILHTAILVSSVAEITSARLMEESVVPMVPSAQVGNSASFSTANKLAATISAAKNLRKAAVEAIPAGTAGVEEAEAGTHQRP